MAKCFWANDYSMLFVSCFVFLVPSHILEITYFKDSLE